MTKAKNPQKKLTCRKINALLKDEAMASEEYKELAKVTTLSEKAFFEQMSKDEARHHAYLLDMKNIENCKK